MALKTKPKKIRIIIDDGDPIEVSPLAKMDSGAAMAGAFYGEDWVPDPSCPARQVKPSGLGGIWIVNAHTDDWGMVGYFRRGAWGQGADGVIEYRVWERLS